MAFSSHKNGLCTGHIKTRTQPSSPILPLQGHVEVQLRSTHSPHDDTALSSTRPRTRGASDGLRQDGKSERPFSVWPAKPDLNPLPHSSLPAWWAPDRSISYALSWWLIVALLTKISPLHSKPIYFQFAGHLFFFHQIFYSSATGTPYLHQSLAVSPDASPFTPYVQPWQFFFLFHFSNSFLLPFSINTSILLVAALFSLR